MVGIQLVSKVGEKGQVVIPKPIRERFNLKKNTELIFDLEDEKLILKKKENSLIIFEEFVNVFPKRKFPKSVDWNKEYYSQFEA